MGCVAKDVNKPLRCLVLGRNLHGSQDGDKSNNPSGGGNFVSSRIHLASASTRLPPAESPISIILQAFLVAALYENGPFVFSCDSLYPKLSGGFAKCSFLLEWESGFGLPFTVILPLAPWEDEAVEQQPCCVYIRARCA